jgi:phosphate transport system substrate-binding protein
MTRRQFLILVAVVANCSTTSCSPRSHLQIKEPPKELIVGAGATFPDPLYKKWVEAYRNAHPDATVTYLAVGSSEGVVRFIDRVVDFGASDAAMTDEEISKVEIGVQLIPTAAGSVVLAYNLPDVKSPLQLRRSTYVDIFLGKITSWDDDKIKADNPDIELPSLPITIVTREDGSGTTFAFTNHLSAVSEEWRDRGPGATKLAKWPVKTIMGAGNEGVAEIVKKTPGAIGYIQYAMAYEPGLAMASLENKAGNFVAPGHKSGFATLVAAPLPENLRAFVPDPDGAESYPIVTYTWLMLYKKYDSAETLKQLKQFVGWCLTEGQKYNEPLGYIPLPEQVASKALAALDGIK